MGSVLEVSILHHVAIVFVVLWLLNTFNYCYPVAYFLSFTYLFLVHERYVIRLRRNLQFEEQRNSNQRRILSESETVRWLNHAIEKMWPVCLEQIVSQKILLPIVPWFLEKYKPWTVKEAVVQQLYLGRTPPMITEMRVHRQSNNDDHLVLELGMNFRTADDMSAILAVKLKKRLVLGMWTKLHLLGMHIEGKALVGVKFVRNWPFLGRVRLCFAEPPYFQMTVKPIFSHGLDVTELPGIAGWMDKLLGIAFEQTLVEPNMLVVDVEKLASPQPEAWFSIDEKEPVAHAIVEVIEGAEMNPSDLNGLADPYVKGQLGPYRFRTKTQKRTLTPKWLEEFKIPVSTWESPNVLAIEVRDKDRFVDDKMGECSVILNDLRDGQRHDIWLSLQNIKVGRLHLAITVVEGSEKKEADDTFEVADVKDYRRDSFATDTINKDSFSSATSDKSSKVADVFEPIDVEGQNGTGIWVHRPGSEVAQVWEAKRGKSRRLDAEIQAGGVGSAGSIKTTASGSHDSSSAEENGDAETLQSPNRMKKGLRKIGTMFHRRQKTEKSVSFDDPFPSPSINLKPMNTRQIGVKFIVDDSVSATPSDKTVEVDGQESSESGSESPNKGKVKDMAKNILKQSARGIKHALSRKGSRRFPLSQDTERDVCVKSDSSVEGSLPSTPVDHIIVASNPISSTTTTTTTTTTNPISSDGKETYNSSENNVPSSNNASIEVERPENNGVTLESKISDLKSGGDIVRNEAVVKTSEKLPDGGEVKAAEE